MFSKVIRILLSYSSPISFVILLLITTPELSQSEPTTTPSAILVSTFDPLSNVTPSDVTFEDITTLTTLPPPPKSSLYNEKEELLRRPPKLRFTTVGPGGLRNPPTIKITGMWLRNRHRNFQEKDNDDYEEATEVKKKPRKPPKRKPPGPEPLPIKKAFSKPIPLISKDIWGGAGDSEIEQVSMEMNEPENTNDAIDQYKETQVQREEDVIRTIAQSQDNINNEDNKDPLRGVLSMDDDDEKESWEFAEDEDEDEDDVDTTSFIIQILEKDKKRTTYHAFEDPTYDKPFFMRTQDDFDSDFIIFIDPHFPSGSGHYVVLRKLESQTNVEDYDLDEGLQSDEYDDMMDELDDKVDGENEEADVDDDYLENARQQLGSKNGGFAGPIEELEQPGIIQSGEEDYADKRDEPDYNPVLNGVEGVPSLKVNTSKDPEVESLKRQFLNVPSELEQDGFFVSKDSEVIYQAFTVIFKDSIHGYISDLDPIQLNFMNDEELDVDALVAEDDVDMKNPEEDYYEEEEEEMANRINSYPVSKSEDGGYQLDMAPEPPSPQEQMMEAMILAATSRSILSDNEDSGEDVIEESEGAKGGTLGGDTGGGDGGGDDGGDDAGDNAGEDGGGEEGGGERKKRSILTFSFSERQRKPQSVIWKHCLRPINVKEKWRTRSIDYFDVDSG